MNRDLRDTPLYQEAEAFYRSVRRPGSGQISDAADLHVSSDGRWAVFSGSIVDELKGAPQTRICRTDLLTGHTQVLTFGPSLDRAPRFSADGRHIAFLSDRHRAGDFQVYLLDAQTGAAQATAPVAGWVEYLHWSPDGTRILLGVAGHGADVSGGQGAVASKTIAQESPSWMPAIETGKEDYRWRRVWIYDLATRSARAVESADNIWEAVWCGDDALAAIASPAPEEGFWYSAHLKLIDVKTGVSRDLYTPGDQLGWPVASPDGRRVAVIEAVCSDRRVVAGELRLIDVSSGKMLQAHTAGVDVSCAEWRSDHQLLVAGHRDFDTVVGVYDVTAEAFTERWSSHEIATGGFYVTVCGLNDVGDCGLIGESFTRAPEIALIESGRYRPVKSFDLGYGEEASAIESAEALCWRAPDGLEIQGWLLRPKGVGPHPLLMYVHGGPVALMHPVSLGRRGAHFLLLLRRGYAIFFPNPRGSSGRGQDFIRHVVGDMGGADTQDYLAGLDFLVERGLADPRRLAVMGVSYGGFMSAWLITQDARFAAAVPVAPVSNQVTEHLMSNIPHFVSLFLRDRYDNPGGKYFDRSPVMHARKARTPTLNICGALDRCTPPAEAVQFHRALLENGVESVLVTYPEEGHGISQWPAAIDYAARVVDWLERHLNLEP